MTRYEFFDVFQLNPDGSLSPRRPIRINGVTFNQGVSFGRGVLFGGINIFDYYGLPITGEEHDGVLIIQGFIRP